MLPLNDVARMKTPEALPADLLDWVDRHTLVCWILEAQQAYCDFKPGEVVSHQSSQRVNPQVLLTLLVYCYATGILASEEIEYRMSEDAMMRYLCARKFPTVEMLRYFRRSNRTLLIQTLAKVMESAWFQRYGRERNERIRGERSIGRAINRDEQNQVQVSKKLAAEAEQRVLDAIRLDSMAMDI